MSTPLPFPSVRVTEQHTESVRRYEGDVYEILDLLRRERRTGLVKIRINCGGTVAIHFHSTEKLALTSSKNRSR